MAELVEGVRLEKMQPVNKILNAKNRVVAADHVRQGFLDAQQFFSEGSKTIFGSLTTFCRRDA